MAELETAHLMAQARSQSSGISFSQGAPCEGQHSEDVAVSAVSAAAAWTMFTAMGDTATASETSTANMARKGSTIPGYPLKRQAVK
jgi:hypothetical protein